MTPIEMAEAMEGRARVRRKITNRENTGDRLSDQLEQAATMLRQQQAEIEALQLHNKKLQWALAQQTNLLGGNK